jgi:two-component system, OmpR family, phosphate regulon sensor histidine kinase PhoR
VTGRIFLKLIAGVVLLLLVALVAVGYNATRVAEDSYIQNLIGQVAGKCRMLALQIPDPAHVDAALARAADAAAGGRVTVVLPDGRVTADSEANPNIMENHRTPSRPELLDAFRGKTGWSIRRSATLGIRFLYVAVPCTGGAAVRIAVPLSAIDAQTAEIRARLLASTALAFLPAVLAAALLARWLSGRFAVVMRHAHELARGDFRTRIASPGSGEFGELARTLNETAVNLQQTVEQLHREHAELEKLERVRKDFVINVSHELRTPLASIQGYTETLLDGALTDPEHNVRFLGIIRQNVQRLTRLTEDLLTLSRIEQKRQALNFEPHSISRLLQDTVDLVRPIAEKRSVALHLEPAGALEVWCDRGAVDQILSNLLDNAVKYTPAGGSVGVGASLTGHVVEVFVRDTGIGIPPEDVPRLFERFYRVDKARSRELGGTGLGLSIVKHLVAAHNGTVRVESVTHQGSTFYFTLPADESALPSSQLNPEFMAL